MKLCAVKNRKQNNAENEEPAMATRIVMNKWRSHVSITRVMYEKNITGSGGGNFRNGGYRVNRDIVGDSGGEEDPLQNPRPPERVKSGLRSQEASSLGGPASGLMMRAKRLSCRLSERASVLWRTSGGSDDQPPPPVPRHRTEKYDTVVSDNNHRRLLDRRTSRAYTCRELLCVVFVPCLLICVLGIVCSALVIHHVLGRVRKSSLLEFREFATLLCVLHEPCYDHCLLSTRHNHKSQPGCYVNSLPI